MKTGSLKKIGFGIAGLLFILLFSVEVLADADYSILYAGWDNEVGNGRMVASWDPADDSKESKTSYRLRLYRWDTSHPVGNWVTVSGTRLEFTGQIERNGTGTYFYMIKPVKGNLEAIESEHEEVDKDQRKEMTRYLEDQAKQAEENFQNGVAPDGRRLPEGWAQHDGYWFYRGADGKLLKASWLKKDGKWYYLSVDGKMLTGWQVIDRKWYCFDGSGAMYANTVTPDGYRVNENGEWVENGEAVTDDRKANRKELVGTVSLLTEFGIPLSERSNGEGEIYTLSVKNAKEARAVEVNFSIPQEQWKLGQPVTITATYETYAGYAFSDKTSFTCSRAKLSGISGTDATRRTFVLTYLPNILLPTPEGFYVDTEDVLHWDPVPKASAYEVRLVNEENRSLWKQKVSGTSFNLADFMAEPYIEVRVAAAPSPAASSYISRSTFAVLKDLADSEQLEPLRITGKFAKTVNGLTYRGDDGELFRNRWALLAGKWYHFNASGHAENEGWFQDGAYWYYFDRNHRMLTGTVTVDGKTWHLNDGTRTDLPVGARY